MTAIDAFVTQKQEKQLVPKWLALEVSTVHKIKVQLVIFWYAIILIDIFLVKLRKCYKGLSYKDDCNVCTCNPITGLSACTKKACIPSNDQSSSYAIWKSIWLFKYLNTLLEDLGKCSKGLEYKDDCNTCLCDPETGESACTKMACPRGTIFSTIKLCQTIYLSKNDFFFTNSQFRQVF